MSRDDRINHEQDLLERYWSSETTVIHDRAPDISESTDELNEQVRDYAARRGLNTDFLPRDDEWGRWGHARDE